jgi:transient receptor potential cation channel subfamily A member 1
LVYIGLNGLREGIQMYQQRFQYLLDPFNIVSWMLYLAALAMVLPLFTDQLDGIQYSCASVTAFLAWFNLLLYLQRYKLVCHPLLLRFQIFIFLKSQHIILRTKNIKRF